MILLEKIGIVLVLLEELFDKSEFHRHKIRKLFERLCKDDRLAEQDEELIYMMAEEIIFAEFKEWYTSNEISGIGDS
jgi:hypothetical protein